MRLEELVRKAKSGDKSAFSELIKQRRTVLYKLAYVYVKNEHDAMEIVDETVYRAYFALSKLKNEQYFNTWITRILINCSIGYIKKSNRIILFDKDIPFEGESTSSSNEEIMDLYDAVDKLQGKYKTAVILKYFNDMTIKEVAEVMECSESNVKNYLHRALSKLRVELKEVCINV